ncbi:MAG TPA: twin-arginine translocation signal domain-containing protein, partial [Bryobacteraceae bacterium]
MRDVTNGLKKAANRRSFLKNTIATGAATVGALGGVSAFADDDRRDDRDDRLTRGDAALLRFAAAAEILETDFWIQYNELG